VGWQYQRQWRSGRSVGSWAPRPAISSRSRPRDPNDLRTGSRRVQRTAELEAPRSGSKPPGKVILEARCAWAGAREAEDAVWAAPASPSSRPAGGAGLTGSASRSNRATAVGPFRSARPTCARSLLSPRGRTISTGLAPPNDGSATLPTTSLRIRRPWWPERPDPGPFGEGIQHAGGGLLAITTPGGDPMPCHREVAPHRAGARRWRAAARDAGSRGLGYTPSSIVDRTARAHTATSRAPVGGRIDDRIQYGRESSRVSGEFRISGSAAGAPGSWGRIRRIGTVACRTT
jgi:hypothetical protein